MEFRKRTNSLFTDAMTQKRSIISYVVVSDDKLVFHENKQSEEFIKEKGEKNFSEVKQPTRLVFYCNFKLTTAMADELERSKILHIDSLSNENRQIIAYPLFGFDYLKLADILIDLCKKFNL